MKILDVTKLDKGQTEILKMILNSSKNLKAPALGAVARISNIRLGGETGTRLSAKQSRASSTLAQVLRGQYGVRPRT